MPSPNLIYYISGHGFGHARRSAQVIGSLLDLLPDATIHVRTHAPARLFADLPPARVLHHEVRLDPGCIEKDLFTIDEDRTIAAMRHALAFRENRVQHELAFLRHNPAQLILSDVPVLAGAVAHAAGIPCIAISNFTWDFIYEPFAPPDLLEEIRSLYGHMETLLRLPVGGCCDRFPQVIDIPHIGGRARRPRQAVLAELGLAADPRPRVLVGMRGGISDHALRRAAETAPDLLFLAQQDVPGPANLIRFTTHGAAAFADVLAASDVVLSKLGYGINADCLANQTPLLWPRRVGFREDAVSERELPRYLRMRELPMPDLQAGHWGPHIHALLAQPRPPERTPTDGDRVAAEWIARRLA